MWRLLRTVLLLKIGVIAGFVGAAALMRTWLTSHGDETSDELDLAAIFDSVDLASHATAFRGGRILAWFGGVALDLREATPAAGGARLDIRAAVGGVSIRVPAGWRVDAEGQTVIGGLAVSVPEPDDPAAPTLVVRAASLVGGVAISE
jgi:Cell wall-active antibiotics response 4TMS YvqF